MSGVNDERTEAESFAAREKSGGLDLRNAGWTAGPHARAGRENLQGVAAELVRRLQRVDVATGYGGVDADAQRAVHPCRRAGFGLRFGAVFVFRVKFDNVGEGLFRHSQ